MPSPEELARENIDKLLTQCGWTLQNRSTINLSAAQGIAIREGLLKGGDEVDYLLFVDGKAIGTVEAKPEGFTLTGVEEQSGKYGKGLLDIYPKWREPLPFAYESTGVETQFTNQLDPSPKSRNVFAFHKPETLLEYLEPNANLNTRLGYLLATDQMPTTNLWSAQIEAIRNLEKSLAANKRRALIQMATGSGKTYTAVNFVYRLIKLAGARRVLFLVDRGNLGDQTLKEFQQFVTPDDGRKFTELYNVQHLQSAQLDRVSRVCISTIQRLYSMLRGEEIDPEIDERSGYELRESLWKQPPPVVYNPNVPIETFDFIITDECHRSIYNLWRQVLEYFDAYLIGLTATPSKQTIGFFNKNLVMEYGHERAVVDQVNVNYDVYKIDTEITKGGSRVDKGFYVDKRDRLTRKVRWEQLGDDLIYAENELDRAVVAGADTLARESNETPGVLTVSQNDPRNFIVTFASTRPMTGDLTAHVALLGFGVTSDVARGENAGHKLTHDFVALSHHESKLRGSPLRADFKLDENSSGSQRRALVAWVSVGNDPTPIQAAGGWLTQPH